MTQKFKIATSYTLFFAVAILHVFGLFYNDLTAFLTKPLLITTLVVLYLLSVSKANFWFVSALFFSFWGDVLLLFKETFFVFGLASFLVAHLLYIKLISSELKKVQTRKRLLVIIAFLLYLVVFLYFILGKVIDIKIPVIVYAFIISIFGMLSALLYLQQKSTANLWLFLGALFFIISDSLIAVNKFYYPSESYQIFIMITYILAQFLICKSFIVKDCHQ